MYDENRLINGARKMGIELTNQQVEQFGLYYQTLVKWNKKTNITRITEGRDIIIDHFLDSIGPVMALDISERTRLCDVGSGAGFPGTPLKIVLPQVQLTLIDSKQKSTIFLKKLIKELNLKDVHIYTGRAEELGREVEHREKYDVVLSRAVAPLQILVELCIPFVSVGGYFIAYKGKKVREEVKKAEKAVNILGGKKSSVKYLKVPFSEKKRYIVLIKKEIATPIKYPRRPGIPKKKPLE